MADGTAHLRLMAWMSPAFPTGGFAYSAGLERAAADGAVHDAASLHGWLETLLGQGGPRNDAILFAQAWRDADDREALAALSALALALAGSSERHGETLAQGEAFLAAARHWFADGPRLPDTPAAYPVAAGATTRLGGAELEAALAIFLQAFVSNQLQAAIRLSLVGQGGAAALLAALEPAIAALARQAAQWDLADLGSFTPLADIACMNHEIQRTRLFLS